MISLNSTHRALIFCCVPSGCHTRRQLPPQFCFRRHPNIHSFTRAIISDPSELSDCESLPSPRKSVRFKDETFQCSCCDGVYFVNGMWEARIQVDGCWYSLGSFDNEDEAGLAFGNYTRIYKPKQGTEDVYCGVVLSQVPKNLPLLKNRDNESGYSGVSRSKGG